MSFCDIQALSILVWQFDVFDNHKLGWYPSGY
jgi:hypothetical protein